MAARLGPAPPAERPLVDRYARTVSYLRLSVTDRCDFRCGYCMPERMTFSPRAEVLSLEELDRVATAFVRRGTRKLRLTGGEPLVRRGVTELAASLGRHLRTGALDELTLTTNGSQLAAHAEALFIAGMRRVNVSLDTLDAGRFTAITRRGRLADVLAGIAAAGAAGLRVKINMVALKGVNEDEIEAMMAWCADGGHDLTLIETMPLGAVDGERADHYLPLSQVRARLDQRWTLREVDDKTGGPARYVRVAETGQRLGFITPLTDHFCATCNRVRLTATGMLYLCLGQDDRLDLRAVLRDGAAGTELDAALDRALDAAMRLKPERHFFRIDRAGAAPAVARHMSLTGG